MIKGSCLCGNISLQIDGEVRNARFCHCVNCRKFSGTGYAAWGLVRADQLTVSAPDFQVTKFDSGGGLRAFCSSCGAPLWYEPAGMPQYRGIPLGVIDEGQVPKPAMHVWAKSKVDWISMPTDCPVYETAGILHGQGASAG
jgi:hypothetical protein